MAHDRYPHSFRAGSLCIDAPEPVAKIDPLETVDQLIRLVNYYHPDVITLPAELIKPKIPHSVRFGAEKIKEIDQNAADPDYVELLARPVIHNLLEGIICLLANAKAAKTNTTAWISCIIKANDIRLKELELKKFPPEKKQREAKEKSQSKKQLVKVEDRNNKLLEKWQKRDARAVHESIQKEGYPFCLDVGVFTLYTFDKVETASDMIQLANFFLVGLPAELTMVSIKCLVQQPPKRIDVNLHPGRLYGQIGVLLLEKAIPLASDNLREILRKTVYTIKVDFAKKSDDYKLPKEQKRVQELKKDQKEQRAIKSLTAEQRLSKTAFIHKHFLLPNLHIQPLRHHTLNIHPTKELPFNVSVLRDGIFPNPTILTIPEGKDENTDEDVGPKFEVEVRYKKPKIEPEVKKADAQPQPKVMEPVRLHTVLFPQAQSQPIAETEESKTKTKGFLKAFCCSSSGSA